MLLYDKSASKMGSWFPSVARLLVFSGGALAWVCSIGLSFAGGLIIYPQTNPPKQKKNRIIAKEDRELFDLEDHEMPLVKDSLEKRVRRKKEFYGPPAKGPRNSIAAPPCILSL